MEGGSLSCFSREIRRAHGSRLPLGEGDSLLARDRFGHAAGGSPAAQIGRSRREGIVGAHRSSSSWGARRRPIVRGCIVLEWRCGGRGHGPLGCRWLGVTGHLLEAHPANPSTIGTCRRVSFARIRSTRDLGVLRRVPSRRPRAQDRRVLALLLALIAAAGSAIRSRANLAIENLALRQQLAVLRRRRPRPPLDWTDRLFWIALSCAWSRWRDALAIVRPDTVVRWHRTAFRRFWSWKSRRPPGRTPTGRDVRDLVRRMTTANSTWGAPRIHGELLKLGIDIGERTVSRLMPREPRKPPPKPGAPSSTIIWGPSPRSTSSPSRPPPPASSLSSLSSPITADAYCTSTSPSTPLPLGPHSRSSKHFPTTPPPST